MSVYVRVVKHQRLKYRRRNRPLILKVSLASEEQANKLVSLSPTLSSSSDYVLRRIRITHDLKSSSIQRPSQPRTNLVTMPKSMTFYNKSNFTQLKTEKNNAVNDNQSSIGQISASIASLVNNLSQSVNT